MLAGADVALEVKIGAPSELKLSAPWPTQSQTTEPQDALENANEKSGGHTVERNFANWLRSRPATASFPASAFDLGGNVAFVLSVTLLAQATF
jgi:hypothetical protein